MKGKDMYGERRRLWAVPDAVDVEVMDRVQAAASDLYIRKVLSWLHTTALPDIGLREDYLTELQEHAERQYGLPAELFSGVESVYKPITPEEESRLYG
jgi:hypothetical protein